MAERLHRTKSFRSARVSGSAKPRSAAAYGLVSAQLAAIQDQVDASTVVQNMTALQMHANAGPRAHALAALQRMADSGSAAGPSRSQTSGGLPSNLQSGVEALSGMSLDNVRVHRNSAAPAQIGAHAYAQGRDIHLAPGQEKHLPHEAWHVVQQAQGRVKPTANLGGAAINDSAELEAEADTMGAKAARGGDSAVQRIPVTGAPASDGPIQMYTVPDDHIRADMRHPKADKLFMDYTLEDVEGRLPGTMAAASNVALETAIAASRAANMMDYTVLSSKKVSSEPQITDFLNKDEDDEHMYVLDDDDVHVAIRAESKKLPHPTLVGGDPDVECAGTLEWEGSSKDTIVVTRESGHFRPDSANPGKKAVEGVVKGARRGHTKKVKARNSV